MRQRLTWVNGPRRASAIIADDATQTTGTAMEEALSADAAEVPSRHRTERTALRKYAWPAGLASFAAVAAAFLLWQWRGVPDLPQGFARGNGRMEGIEVEIATKLSGRIREVLVDDGDFVAAGQVVVRMDTQVLRAALAQANARVEEARHAKAAALAIVAQRRSEAAAATALLVQRRSERDVALKKLDRSRYLAEKHSISAQQHDEDVAAAETSKAAVDAAAAQLAAAQAATEASRAQVVQAESAIGAATASADSIQADIDDSELRAPRAGRIQYRISQAGEVLGAGGKVLSLLDTGDVYMSFFLPEAEAGRVALGSEARIVLDAAPGYVIPATVSYVASVAQFTPKTVETESERQKLMFRVKARIAADLLQRYRTQVKTGLPGVAYVRLDPKASWPPKLQTEPAR